MLENAVNRGEMPLLSALTYFAFEVNAAIDQGYADRFSLDEIYEYLDNGVLIEKLTERLIHVCDLSIFPSMSQERRKLEKAITLAAEGLRGRERKKTGIERSGLCLLMAFALEAIQAGYWVTLSLRYT